MRGTGKGTFSIVAADRRTGEVGVAVQSKYFAVGLVVPWAEAGVGAVATQAAGVAAYGREALEELRGGVAPEEALERVLLGDAGRETRQLGVVTSDGAAAAWTGSQCQAWAGHRVGEGYVVLGNILAGETVVTEMERAWLETTGSFEHRLASALEAAQAAGGDARGQQSAALVVERLGAAAEGREGIDRVCQLHVEDHEQPIVELRRLLGIHERWLAMQRTWWAYEQGRYDEAAELAELSLAKYGEDKELTYNLACFRALQGRGDEAVELLRRCADAAGLLVQARADADFAGIREREDFKALVGQPAR